MSAKNRNNDSITNILINRMIDQITDNIASMLAYKIIHDIAIILFNILAILYEYAIGVS